MLGELAATASGRGHLPPMGRGRRWVVRSAELIVVLELHQQGMTVSAIARRTWTAADTVEKHRTWHRGALTGRGRRDQSWRRRALPASASREFPNRPAAGGAARSAGRDMPAVHGAEGLLRQVRPRPATGFEIRFERRPAVRRRWTSLISGTVFTDEPGAERIVRRSRSGSVTAGRRGAASCCTRT